MHNRSTQLRKHMKTNRKQITKTHEKHENIMTKHLKTIKQTICITNLPFHSHRDGEKFFQAEQK